jgi:hypothetical protein
VNATIHRKLTNSKRRIDSRLDKTKLAGCHKPMFTASNIHYQIADRCHGMAHEQPRATQADRQPYEAHPEPTSRDLANPPGDQPGGSNHSTGSKNVGMYPRQS